ncbi:hypothetical protein CBF45_05410 [Bordetella sp. J329]|jgi:NADPH-dependent 7-cyano-7-deazaguanine reductase QueF|uniref:hypothetical protein n=1 Tax=Kerstersia gyiorum TaxID=206506 RepID=UPI000FD92F95|nr:hypothetical protein [Kerstersia gyiorum]AZV93221.1 hypothetical protein CBF45_05410 [Bordetella sp. J329]MCH4271466.1 hypothetical protein [Kerstersia gyiorum]MCI1228105.1 hypothetical protein [Kerstersia gyiorum]
MNDQADVQVDHTLVPSSPGDYRTPDTGAVLKTIANPAPMLRTWQEHELVLPELCPASRNPGAGSCLCIRYRSRTRFLEVFSLGAYIRAFIGHRLVRDVEMLTQVVARDCAHVLGHQVEVEGCFVLPALGQTVRTRVQAGRLPRTGKRPA